MGNRRDDVYVMLTDFSTGINNVYSSIKRRRTLHVGEPLTLFSISIQLKFSLVFMKPSPPTMEGLDVLNIMGGNFSFNLRNGSAVSQGAYQLSQLSKIPRLVLSSL